MNKNVTLLLTSLSLLSIAACSSDDNICALNDAGCDGIPDDLGRAVERDGVSGPDLWDVNEDGSADGWAVDRNDDGVPDALGLDTNGDGFVDSVDLNFDGVADETTGSGTYGTANPATGTPAPGTLISGGTGGAVAGTGGAAPVTPGLPGATGGGSTVEPGTGGSTSGPFVSCLDDGGAHAVEGRASGSDDSVRYAKSDVKRGTGFYRLITNGWGDNWYNHDISWVGTQMSVNSFSGDIHGNYSPAGYPTIYVGNYSNTGTSNNSPLPRAISSLSEVNTGVRWSHPANSGEYNVAYDVWLSNNGNHSGYFMVWLRDPPGQQPAGNKREQGVSVPGVEGVWDIWAGDVFGKPIINYVRAEGTATKELSFDVLTFIDHAKSVGYTIPGSEIMSVAIGFEIWQGPVSNLKLDDFCVTVK